MYKSDPQLAEQDIIKVWYQGVVSLGVGVDMPPMRSRVQQDQGELRQKIKDKDITDSQL